MDKQQRRSSRSAAAFQRDGEGVAKLAMGSSGCGPANAISVRLLKHDQLESLAAPVPHHECGGGCVQRYLLTQPQMQRSGLGVCTEAHSRRRRPVEKACASCKSGRTGRHEMSTATDAELADCAPTIMTCVCHSASSSWARALW
jgi:hypothetical protein